MWRRASEPEETVRLDHDAAVLESRFSKERGSVVTVGVDDEELAARLIFPAKAEIGRHRIGRRGVLDERRDEHARRHRESRARTGRPNQRVRTGSLDPVHRDVRLDTELTREPVARVQRQRLLRAVVELPHVGRRDARQSVLLPKRQGRSRVAEAVAAGRHLHV